MLNFPRLHPISTGARTAVLLPAALVTHSVIRTCKFGCNWCPSDSNPICCRCHGLLGESNSLWHPQQHPTGVGEHRLSSSFVTQNMVRFGWRSRCEHGLSRSLMYARWLHMYLARFQVSAVRQSLKSPCSICLSLDNNPFSNSIGHGLAHHQRALMRTLVPFFDLSESAM